MIKGSTAWMVCCASLLVVDHAMAADPLYVGRWNVNEEKTDYGPAFNFARTSSGDVRFAQEDQSYVIRFDGKDYPHPLGGVQSWKQLDDRTWETTLKNDAKVIGVHIYKLSDDGQTLTTSPGNGFGSTIAYRRTSKENTGLVGFWSVKTTTNPVLQIEVAPGYDIIVRAGGASCQANFDDRDYPTLGPTGEATQWSTCSISKEGERGFTFSVKVNGQPFAADTYTLSEEGHTLTQIGGLVGRPPNHTIVYDRQ